MFKVFKEKLLFHLITKTACVLLYIIPLTLRLREKNADAMNQIGKEKIIFALWHNRFFIMPYYSSIFRKKTNLIGLASRSKDGKFIGRVLEIYKYKVVYGSSKKGGDIALKQLSKHLIEDNYAAAITVDGPTGPIYKAKPGIVKLAHLTQAPIVPISCTFSSFYTLTKSWDKFLIPKPFSKCFVTLGEPIWVKNELTKEKIASVTKEIEDSLHNLSSVNE